MTQRTAGLNLEWAQWNSLEWGANLPPIPGYPGTRYDGNVYAVVSPSLVNGDVYGFRLHISINADDNIVLDNVDFDIPDGTAEEMMAAVDNLSLRSIEDMLDDMGYGPIDNPTAARHASKRIASMDLNWWQTSAGMWAADLPEIPGFPCAPGRYWHVGITSMHSDDTDEFLGYGFDIGILGAHGGTTLFENEFGFPYVDTQEEAMQEVESLSPEMIAQAAEDAGLEPVEDAAAFRHASKRSAALDLDWEHGDPASTLGDLELDWTRCLDDYAEYEAYLPALPGYPEMGDKDSLVYVAPRDGEYTFWMDIAVMQGQIVTLADRDFDIPSCGTADEMMQAVESLTIQDILDALTAIGWGPDDD